MRNRCQPQSSAVYHGEDLLYVDLSMPNQVDVHMIGSQAATSEFMPRQTTLAAKR